jgi:hypothetical protein
MNSFVTLMMALFFLWVGVYCLHRPQQVQQWLVAFYRQNRPDGRVPSWLSSRGVVVFTRFMGLLCMINFIMLLYLLTHHAALSTGE